MPLKVNGYSEILRFLVRLPEGHYVEEVYTYLSHSQPC